MALRDDTPEVERLAWPRFVEKFRQDWQPGQHLSLIAPNGAGKSTFAHGILNLRRYALGLDPKGGDDVLASLGWPRLGAWPGDRRMAEMVRDNDEHGRPSRYIVGPVAKTGDDLPRVRQAQAEALRAAFDMGGWTVYVDELQVLSDRRMMNLSGSAARLLVSARSKGVTFVSSFQAPSWVPTEALRQPYWVAVAYTRDRDTVRRLAEVMGRPRPVVEGAVRALDPYWWLVVGRNPREPMILTRPPRAA